MSEPIGDKDSWREPEPWTGKVMLPHPHTGIRIEDNTDYATDEQLAYWAAETERVYCRFRRTPLYWWYRFCFWLGEIKFRTWRAR